MRLESNRQAKNRWNPVPKQALYLMALLCLGAFCVFWPRPAKADGPDSACTEIRAVFFELRAVETPPVSGFCLIPRWSCRER